MQNTEMDGVPPSIILDWILARWKLISACAAIGLLVAAAYHLTTEQRFTTRIDFSISRSPLGNTAFIERVSEAFLNKQLNGAARVAAHSVADVVSVSITSANHSRADISAEAAKLKNSVTSFEGFLAELASDNYLLIQEDIKNHPNNAKIYSSLSEVRTYVSAKQSGFLNYIKVTKESAYPQRIVLLKLLVLGVAVGCAIGVAAGLLREAISNRPSIVAD